MAPLESKLTYLARRDWGCPMLQRRCWRLGCRIGAGRWLSRLGGGCPSRLLRALELKEGVQRTRCLTCDVLLAGKTVCRLELAAPTRGVSKEDGGSCRS